MLTISFTDGLFKFTDGEFISPSVPTDNPYLPMVNCLTIGTDGTDGQCFGGLPKPLSLMLTTSFTDGLYKFTDGEFISPSVPTDNPYLPMVNCLTIGSDGTDGQCIGGLPKPLSLMLTTSFTDGLYKFTDREFISPFTDGLYKFRQFISPYHRYGESLITGGELPYHRYRRYRRTVFWWVTLCHRYNANCLIHGRTLQIYRW